MRNVDPDLDPDGGGSPTADVDPKVVDALKDVDKRIGAAMAGTKKDILSSVSKTLEEKLAASATASADALSKLLEEKLAAFVPAAKPKEGANPGGEEDAAALRAKMQTQQKQIDSFETQLKAEKEGRLAAENKATRDRFRSLATSALSKIPCVDPENCFETMDHRGLIEYEPEKNRVLLIDPVTAERLDPSPDFLTQFLSSNKLDYFIRSAGGGTGAPAGGGGRGGSKPITDLDVTAHAKKLSTGEIKPGSAEDKAFRTKMAEQVGGA